MVQRAAKAAWRGFVRWHKVVLAAAVLCACGGYVWKNREQFGTLLQRFDWQYVPWVAASAVLLLALNGFIARQMIAVFGVTQSPLEWLGLSVVNAMGNYLKPLPVGAVARGVYLNRVRGLSYSDYSVTLVANYFVQVEAAIVCGLVSMVWLRYVAGMRLPLWLWIVSAGILLLLPALTLAVPRIRWLRIGRFGPTFMDGWSLFWRQRRMLVETFVLQIAFVTTSACGIWLALRSIGMETSFFKALFVSVLPIIVQVYSVLPGGFGIREISAGLMGYVLGLDPKFVGTATFVVGLVTVAAVLVLGAVLAHWLNKSYASAERPGSIVKGGRECA